jgi:hypothetical protein
VTPEQEDAVRRALAATARAEDPGPIPPAVADRLDDVLAELTGPRRAPVEQPDEVAARRRRRWPQAMVAAAAVCVIAAAGGAVLSQRSGGGDGSSASSASSTSGGTTQDHTAAGAEAAPSQPGPSAVASSATGMLRAPRLPRLRSSTLTHDVQALVVGQVDGVDAAGRLPAPPTGCEAPTVRRGERTIDVRLDGRPATLVLGPAGHGTRKAAVFSCHDPGVPTATTTVRAR